MSVNTENNLLAVLDLGSNTFHLLIVALGNNGFEVVHRNRQFVGLAEGGAQTIKDSALQRAKETLEHFKTEVDQYKPDHIKIFGTAALRMASNAQKVAEVIEKTLGESLEIIGGKREAELIYKGAALLTDFTAHNDVIIDIGGGSTEYILIENGIPTWSQSFDIGVALLHEQFHKSEPIADHEIHALKEYLSTVLQPLKEAIAKKPIHSLIGSSGSFEVIISMAGKELLLHEMNEITHDDFVGIRNAIVHADFDSRADLEGMPASRVKLIVVAFLLIEHTLQLIDPTHLWVSPYALKEGVISEYLS